MKRRILTVYYLVLMAWSLAAAEEIHVRAVFDEADAALAIMDNLNAGDSVTGEQWQTLWQSEGYTRLLARQASMNLDDGFGDKLAAWLQDPANYNRAASIRNSVDRYLIFDANTAGDRAGAYLPEEIILEASIYPVIKHTTNTFVYDLNGDPAIFMSVNPENTHTYVQAVLTHELHHIGLAKCPEIPGYKNLTENQQWVTNMLTIFSEGLAVLATAGDPDTHPHFYNTPDEWAVWERDVTNIASDQARIESFFLTVLDGTQPKDERRKTLFTFIVTPEVPQGPAYTLGWKMASMVEKRFGREALVRAMCDPRKLLTLYNQVARETYADGLPNLPLWSDDLIRSLYAQ